MDSIGGILFLLGSFLILLTVLVFVHEWGHYIVGRLFGVKVETFSIGFGKELFGWNDKRGTRWKIAALPFGGYVKFFGDASAISNPGKYMKRIAPEDRDKCFHFKPIWQRMLIVVAGPAINLVLAVAIFFGLNLYVGKYTVVEPVIEVLEEGSPAAEAGLEVGDRFLEANGNEITNFETLQFIVLSNPGREIEFVMERETGVFTTTIIPEVVETKDRFGHLTRTGKLGIQSTFQGLRDFTVVSAFQHAVGRVKLMISGIIDFLGRAFTGQASLDEVGGPVKIAQYSGLAAEGGALSFISFMGAISVALGFINILPIPLLDGGHLMFYSIEAVKGRPVSMKAQELASMIGLAFVLTWFVIITWNDLQLPGLG